MLGNPVMFVDPNGMSPDHWVESENGEISWKENVTSANDVDLQKGDTYLGTSGLGINEDTGQTVLYKSDGTTTEFTSTAIFSDVTVTGKRISKKSLLSLEGHAKLTYGTLGANAEVLGKDYGALLKFEGDLIGITVNTNDRSGVPFLGYTDATIDKTLDVGVEGGYIVGGGYKREFDINSGTFMPSDEIEYAPGVLPGNVIINTYSNSASFRIGGGLKAGIGFGFDVEGYLMINLPSKR